MKQKAPIAFVLSLLLLTCQVAFAEYVMKPIEETTAYEGFSQRVRSELSILLYLVDRFKEEDVNVVYDGTVYKGSQVAPLILFFLKTNLKDEKAKIFIKKYAVKSHLLGNWVLIEYPNGHREKAYKALLDELDLIEEKLKG